MDLLLVIVIGVIAVAVVTALAERLGVAGPLLLVALGLAIGLLPFVEVPEIDPELILVGVLPPLLYASAVRLPAIEFRRDLAPISGLAVVLVIITALVLGWFFSLVLPGVGFALGVALGAIISPTDAVATSIAKRLGISPRVTTMLEGESLLNDATALVLLRTALIAAVAGTFSFGSAVGAFVWAVFIAIVIGALVGFLTLRLRAWVRSSAASTAIGFTVPFLAYLPTEHLNGSGLVAAVIAGIVSGQGAARWFTPEQRLSDQVNWRTVELVLEGGIFLIMGLELDQIVSAVAGRHEETRAGHHGGAVRPRDRVGGAGRLRLAAAVVDRNRASRMDRSQFERMDARLDQISENGWPDRPAPRGRSQVKPSPERAERRLMTARAGGACPRRFRLLPVVAAGVEARHRHRVGGMRGVVTLAAARSDPAQRRRPPGAHLHTPSSSPSSASCCKGSPCRGCLTA
ncbi:MAG: sodium:proton antiporter [Microbacterium sp.]